ncbi:hypothetical protein LZ480_08530 [Solibacillus sp. MA9]|uniref:Flagellar hook-associated protein 2 C-terminal domain-containing protein n=1 Tax=Solibacillus palustris TaxID=2908203 RepID=A0ABS9UC66_9BACL|nr:hypothetical protein [Solibacillus sp. MA9]MCH7321937.1 hypothetical protein [Solibacillus sp. MA9]
MSMDVSSLNSLTSLLGSTYGTNSATSANTSSTSFETYFLNALGTNSTGDTSSMSSLLDLYSNGGTNALLSGFTSTDSTSTIASQLLSNLQSSGTTDSSLMKLNKATSATDNYTDSLTSGFQSQVLNNMNAAKAKLQSSYESYVERMGENPTAAAQYRIDQMKQNISVIENYIASKSANNVDSLVDQLDAKSALTQYMLNL